MNNAMNEAAGIIEVYGFAAAVAAGDAACKAANVRIESFDRNKPAGADKLAVPLLIAVKLRGSVADVRAAVTAAEAAAMAVSGVAASHIIARPDTETEKMLRLNMFEDGAKSMNSNKDDSDEGEYLPAEENDEEDIDGTGSTGND